MKDAPQPSRPKRELYCRRPLRQLGRKLRFLRRHLQRLGTVRSALTSSPKSSCGWDRGNLRKKGKEPTSFCGSKWILAAKCGRRQRELPKPIRQKGGCD